jgi:hypothetical protein
LIAVKDADGDQDPDLIVGLGIGGNVTAYEGKSIPPDGVPPVLGSFDALGNFRGGVFVG